MGRFVIAAYRPHAGKEAEALAELRGHVPTLRARGLATARPALLLRARDGAFVEVFEWVSEAAIARAHEDPAVQAMWGRFATVCDYVALASLAEAQAIFAEFDAVDPEGA